MENQPTDSYDYYQDDEYSYYFLTKDRRRYSVIFEEQSFVDDKEFISAGQTYELFLTLQKGPPSYTTDAKIGVTLASIIRNFIENDPSRLVFFTCDTADGRHLARYRRFNDWFRENNDGHYLKLEDSIPYPTIKKLFLITLIVRNDNPQASEILSSFVSANAYLRAQK